MISHPFPSDSSSTPLDFQTDRVIPVPYGRTSTALLPAPLVTPPEATSLPQPTTPQVPATLLQTQLQRLARLSDEETFEDGIETALSRGVVYLLERYATPAVQAISDLYLAGLLKPVILSEMLPWLGRTQQTDTFDQDNRFWLLVYCLRDPHPFVRSGAALGLAALDYSASAPYLVREAQTEPIPLLRGRLINVANELSL